MKKLIQVLAGIFMVSTLLTGCGGKKEDPELNVGYFNNVTHGQALYMKSNGP